MPEKVIGMILFVTPLQRLGTPEGEEVCVCVCVCVCGGG